MKVILRNDIDRVGKKGDILEVSNGYARNYLLPRGYAMVATDGAVAQAGAMRRARDAHVARERGASEEVATRLVAAVIAVKARAGEGGRLFGSVTSADIVGAVAEQTGIELDRRRVHLADPIRSIGTHSVQVKMPGDVEVPLTVEVEAR